MISLKLFDFVSNFYVIEMNEFESVIPDNFIFDLRCYTDDLVLT